ncbi:MAG: hypothetical protein ABIA75_01485 [Candidatus Neomarinimicrobiota bacterium]
MINNVKQELLVGLDDDLLEIARHSSDPNLSLIHQIQLDRNINRLRDQMAEMHKRLNRMYDGVKTGHWS